MTAANGISVEIARMPNGKEWVLVKAAPSGSPVAFRDLFHQVQMIVECEVLKYGGDPENCKDWDRWGRLPREFMARCFEWCADYDTLRVEFELPR